MEINTKENGLIRKNMDKEYISIMQLVKNIQDNEKTVKGMAKELCNILLENSI